MAVLALIAMAQLVVSVLLLTIVLQETTRQQIERAASGQTVADIRQRTVRDLYRAAEEAQAAGPARQPDRRPRHG